MFKKLFKNKTVGFCMSLAVSLLSLFLMIFYAAYMGKHGLFNGGVLVLYLFAFLLPTVYFFVKENEWTRVIPILQTVFLALAFGLTVMNTGKIIVAFATGSLGLLGTTATGEPILAILIITVITLIAAIIASFMRQTKPLTAEQQIQVDESWSSFKAGTKEFAVKHKKPLIISGVAFVVLVIFLIILGTVIIPLASIVHVGGVTFDQKELVLYETDSRKVIATVAPEGAENRNIEFSSSNEAVATVNQKGVIKAVAPGTATITVTTQEGGYVDECSVEVKELTVIETTIAKMPTTVHYEKGDEFNPSGISIVATLTNGKTQKINARSHKLSYDVTTVDEKQKTVTATYEYREKTFQTSFVVYGDVAEVSDERGFATAYANATDYDYIRCTKNMVFDNLRLNRDITIEGIISANSLIFENNAAVVVKGRVNDFTIGGAEAVAENADVSLAISGEGTLDIQTVYGNEKDDKDNGPMERDIAGVWVTNGFSVDGVKLSTTGIHVENGDFAVSGGADVTVLGQGYIKNEVYNGIDLYNGSLTVEGEGTRLAVLNASSSYIQRAAVECRGILVDNGAEFVVGSAENTDWNYCFAAYCGGNGGMITVRNGSTVKVDAALKTSSASGQCFCGFARLNVLGNSTFELKTETYFGNAVSCKFDKDANIIVNEVKFDMTLPVEQLKFGDQGMTAADIKMDSGVKFNGGDEFNGQGITLEAVFEGQNQKKLNIDLGIGYELTPVTLQNGWNTVSVTVLGTVKEIKVYANPVLKEQTVSSKEEFATALADESIGRIILTNELTFESLTITREIWVDGNIKTSELTVNEGATLHTLGRIWSDGDMTVSGKGTVDATMYEPTEGTREEYAAIRTSGALTISGTTVDCSNLATGGDLTINESAKVTVYGKNAVDSNGEGVNGIHSPGRNITVRGASTVLKVLYNGSASTKTPAAFQANSILIDGATLYIGSETGASWSFGIWFDGSNNKIEATNGAQVTFEIRKPNDWGYIIGGDNPSLYVRKGESVTGEDTSFTVITTPGKFNTGIVKEGTVTVMTPEEADNQ